MPSEPLTQEQIEEFTEELAGTFGPADRASFAQYFLKLATRPEQAQPGFPSESNTYGKILGRIQKK